MKANVDVVFTKGQEFIIEDLCPPVCMSFGISNLPAFRIATERTELLISCGSPVLSDAQIYRL